MIKNIRIYPEFNSKGKESIKAKVYTERGVYSASVPSGTSKGIHEAVEVPVERAFRFFSEIRPHIVGRDENKLDVIDSLLRKLDGTDNFSRMGGNLSLAISIASARAAMNNELWRLVKPRLSTTFPLPVGNVIGGGIHGGGTDWQEFLIIPYRAKTPFEAVKTMLEIWMYIGDDLRKKGLLIGKNIENAWMARMNEFKTLEYLSDIAEDWDVKLGVDIAASDFWNGKIYEYQRSGKTLTTSQHIQLVEELIEKYNIYYIEDPIHEEGFRQFMFLNKKFGRKRLIVGDDLYATNPKRLKKGIKHKSTNAIIIKPNQIGTLTETNEVVNLARKSGMVIIPSHRSGETYDNWLADLAVAWNAPLIKSGITGADMPKLNRLIELWEEIPNVKMASLPLC